MILLNILSFNIISSFGILLEFLLFSKKSDKVFSYRLPLLFTIILLLHILYEISEGILSVESTFLYLILSVSYLFGYFNSLAFIKRGITFSILINRSNKDYESVNESEFIDLDMRIMEMKNNNWILDFGSKFTLTRKGKFVLFLYRFFLKLFRVKPVG